MSRTLALALLALLFPSTPANAQNRFVFGYTHSDDGVGPAGAQLVTDRGTFVATGRGWFDQTGFHHRANDNYLAGRYDGLWYRNYFLFDIGSSGLSFQTAVLRLYNPSFVGPSCFAVGPCNGYSSANPEERYWLSFLPPPYYGDVFEHALGRTDIYVALGGPRIGARTVTSADNGSWVDIGLDARGLDHLNRADGRFGVGGRLAGDIDLVATPEPSTVVLTSSGLLVLAIATRRRRAG